MRYADLFKTKAPCRKFHLDKETIAIVKHRLLTEGKCSYEYVLTGRYIGDRFGIVGIGFENIFDTENDYDALIDKGEITIYISDEEEKRVLSTPPTENNPRMMSEREKEIAHSAYGSGSLHANYLREFVQINNLPDGCVTQFSSFQQKIYASEEGWWFRSGISAKKQSGQII